MTLKKAFTITKATSNIGRRYADILEGEPLSSIDSTLLEGIGAGKKIYPEPLYGKKRMIISQLEKQELRRAAI